MAIVGRCPACGRREQRSSEANRRYWKLVATVAETLRPAGQIHGAEAWHLWFKSRFLGCQDVRLPNGVVLTVPHSSADLDTVEFATYMEQVEAWAAEHGAHLDE